MALKLPVLRGIKFHTGSLKSQVLAKFHRDWSSFMKVMDKFVKYNENSHGNQASIHLSMTWSNNLHKHRKKQSSTHGPMFVVKLPLQTFMHVWIWTFQCRLIDSNLLFLSCKKIAFRYSIKRKKLRLVYVAIINKQQD